MHEAEGKNLDLDLKYTSSKKITRCKYKHNNNNSKQQRFGVVAVIPHQLLPQRDGFTLHQYQFATLPLLLCIIYWYYIHYYTICCSYNYFCICYYFLHVLLYLYNLLRFSFMSFYAFFYLVTRSNTSRTHILYVYVCI